MRFRLFVHKFITFGSDFERNIGKLSINESAAKKATNKLLTYVR
jgi:hypothetical protein